MNVKSTDRKEVGSIMEQVIQKKAVFFDIDGTLYDRMQNFPIPDSTRTAIRKIQEAGNLAIICTGRCDAAVETSLRELGFDGYILGCGTDIIFNGEELYYTTLSLETLNQLHTISKKYHGLIVMEGKHCLFMDKEDAGEESEEIYQSYSKLFQSKILPITGSIIEASKVMVRLYPRTDKAVKSFEADMIQMNMQVFDHGIGLEVVPNGYSKATGIRRLIEKLGIPRENTYAFGDSFNDLSMLHYVEYGIAVGNAHPGILEACRYQTDSIFEDGIYKACEKFQLF